MARVTRQIVELMARRVEIRRLVYRGGSVIVAAGCTARRDGNRVSVEFQDADGALLSREFKLRTSIQPSGGLRPWIVCPRCWNRRQVLFVADSGDLGCRRCFGLNYACQRLSHREERFANRLQEIGGNLGRLTDKQLMTWFRIERLKRAVRLHGMSAANKQPAEVVGE